jgi:hypothetical protein
MDIYQMADAKLQAMRDARRVTRDGSAPQPPADHLTPEHIAGIRTRALARQRRDAEVDVQTDDQEGRTMKAEDVTDLPAAAQEVIEHALSEAWMNTEASDVHSAADVAMDIVERLTRVYDLPAAASALSP